MTSLDRIPRHRRGYRFEELEGESLLYHHGRKKTIYLNESAMVIWKLSDGVRTIADIGGLINQAYAGSHDDITTDVCDCIDKLINQGALTFDPLGPPTTTAVQGD